MREPSAVMISQHSPAAACSGGDPQASDSTSSHIVRGR